VCKPLNGSGLRPCHTTDESSAGVTPLHRHYRPHSDSCPGPDRFRLCPWRSDRRSCDPVAGRPHSDSCPGPNRFRLCPWRSDRRSCDPVAGRPRTGAGLPSCAHFLSRGDGKAVRAVPTTPPQPHAACACYTAWGISLRPLHKGSAYGLSVSRLLWVHLAFAPRCYGPPVRNRHALWGWRPNPSYLNAPVARTRPVGRHTLNRQLAWKAPFILQDRERLCSAYVRPADLQNGADKSMQAESAFATRRAAPHSPGGTRTMSISCKSVGCTPSEALPAMSLDKTGPRVL